MKYHLFDVVGVELEYMIVDQDSLRVCPIADQVFKECTGSFTADFDNGAISWSNELVAHVIEIKTNGPAASFAGLNEAFHQNVLQINEVLAPHNAVLMPGGAHPTVDPLTETKIWPHEHNEVYSLYNRIFDCKGHGWSNLQSTHINLPFSGDDEFRKLHAAIRAILPVIPALTASTPILDGQLTGFKDTRLEYYRKNQERIPVIAGRVIPEPVYSKSEYQRAIFDPINAAIRPYDKDGILDHHFLNSRGAIARFDRGAIEIRVIDIQECPRMDLAILQLLVAVIRGLTALDREDLTRLAALETTLLSDLFLRTIRRGESAVVKDPKWLESLQLSPTTNTATEVWQQLFERHRSELPADAQLAIECLLDRGSLATRMIEYCGNHPTLDRIASMNRALIEALQQNQAFLP